MTHVLSSGTEAFRNGSSAVYQRSHGEMPAANRTPFQAATAPTHDIEHLLSAALAYARMQLLEACEDEDADNDGNARAFLESAGFSFEQIRALGFGTCPSPEAMARHLRGLGFTSAMIAECGLFGGAESESTIDCTGAILAPIHDAHGQLADLAVFEAPFSTGAGRHPRLVRGWKTTGIPLYGYHAGRNSRANDDHDLVVENLFDAWWLQAQGFSQAVAICGSGSDLTAERWEAAARDGIVITTLVLDSGDRWYGSTRNAVENALRAHRAPEIRVVSPAEAGLLTAADYVRRHGAVRLQKLLATATRVYPPKDYENILPTAPVRVPQFDRRSWACDAHPLTNSLMEVIDRGVSENSRSDARAFVRELDQALRSRDFATARRLADAVVWVSLSEESDTCRCESMDTVLDRLTTPETSTAIPAAYAEHRGNVCEAGQYETIVCSTRRGQLAAIASRITTALTTTADHDVVAVCRQFTPDEVLLAVMTNLVQSLSDDVGLAVEEVRSRLTGKDVPAGYSDKPWLVDETVDRLRRQAGRLTFVSGPSSTDAVVEQLKQIRSRQAFHMLILDTVPAVGFGESDSNHDFPGEAWGVRFGCGVVCVTDQQFELEFPSRRFEPIEPVEVVGEKSAGRRFHRLIGDWISDVESRRQSS